MKAPSTHLFGAPHQGAPAREERIYCLLLRAYPRAFRAEYGREMMQLFRDQRRLRDAGIVGFWMHLVWDVARSAPVLRIEAWRAQESRTTRTLRFIMKLVAMLTVLLGVFGTLSSIAEGVMGMRQGGVGGVYLLAILLAVVAGVLLLVAGVAGLRGTPAGRRTASYAALASLVVFMLARLLFGWMSIFAQLVGIALPLVILAMLHWPRRRAAALVCLLAIGLPASASAQALSHDTSAASVAMKDLPLTAAQRQVYVGVYTVSLPQGEQTTVNVYEQNGALNLLPGNQDESRKLVYQGDNVFFAGGDPNFALVFVVENGHATRFTVNRADGVIEGVRMQ